jgi:hypothetical protein
MEFSVMPSKEDAAKKLTKENVLKLFSAGYLTVTLSRDF